MIENPIMSVYVNNVYLLMKLTIYCIECLRGLAEKTIHLAGGDGSLLDRAAELVYSLTKDKKITPPEVANFILRFIKDNTGVYDPYHHLKDRELIEAKKAFERVEGLFEKNLEGVIKLSAMGNSMDFFIDDGYRFDASKIKFHLDMDKIEEEIYISGKAKDILIFGDNIGDFVFDMPLVRFLEGIGRKVYYAIKTDPVQNDLSMPDVRRHGLEDDFPNIVTTGTAEVGIRREDMRGLIRELWEMDAIVIAKGMGNYETMSEYKGERPVMHIMKVKCRAVSEEIGYPLGHYVLILEGRRS